MTLHLTRRFLYLFYFILFLLGEERDSGKFLVDIDAPCSIFIDRTHSAIFSMSNIDKLKLGVVNPNSPVSSTHDASWLKMAGWTLARYARLFKVNDFLNFISFLLDAGSIVSKVIEFADLSQPWALLSFWGRDTECYKFTQSLWPGCEWLARPSEARLCPRFFIRPSFVISVSLSPLISPFRPVTGRTLCRLHSWMHSLLLKYVSVYASIFYLYSFNTKEIKVRLVQPDCLL